jgi:hypothetical protein
MSDAGQTARALATQGYAVLPRLLDPAFADFLWQYMRMKIVASLVGGTDKQVRLGIATYGDAAFDALLETVRPKVEAASGVALHPTYSYARFYMRSAVLHRHRDRPACEISVSLNLGQIPSDPWALSIAGLDGRESAALLQPGDALLYRGIECPHWRDAYTGEQLGQVFLHYVDRNGPHAGQKFDGRKRLMDPQVNRHGNER